MDRWSHTSAHCFYFSGPSSRVYCHTCLRRSVHACMDHSFIHSCVTSFQSEDDMYSVHRSETCQQGASPSDGSMYICVIVRNNAIAIAEERVQKWPILRPTVASAFSWMSAMHADCHTDTVHKPYCNGFLGWFALACNCTYKCL